VANYNGNDVMSSAQTGQSKVFASDQTNPPAWPSMRMEIFMLPIGTMTFLSFYPTVFLIFCRPPGRLMVRARRVLRSTRLGIFTCANYWNNAIYKFDSTVMAAFLPARVQAYNNPFGLA